MITPDHLFKAIALYDSLNMFGTTDFYILSVCGDLPKDLGKVLGDDYTSVHVLYMEDIYTAVELDELQNRYGVDSDEIRWISKSRLMLFAITVLGYRKVLYLDCDLFFFHDYSFLFSALETDSVILTPHWRPIYPGVNKIQFYCNFTDGLFNAGFIGASYRGTAPLQWWHEMCRSRCECSRSLGLFVDQKYLDLLPLHFEKTGILRHRGCNVAEWNRNFLKREKEGKRIVIDGKWPLVFIHFTSMTIQYIENGQDQALEQPLHIYKQTLSRAKQLTDNRIAGLMQRENTAY